MIDSQLAGWGRGSSFSEDFMFVGKTSVVVFDHKVWHINIGPLDFVG